MASNATAAFGIPPLPDYKLESQPNIISWLADPYLTLACPVIAYWAVSMVFHVIDVYNLFPQYRLHTPAELLKRNHATRWEVCRDVLLQQVIQTLFGIALSFLEDDPLTGKDDYNVAVWAQRIRIAQSGIPAILATLGVNAGGLSSKMAMGYPTASNILAGGHYPSLLQTIAVNGELIAAPAFASWEMTVAKAIYWVGIPAVQFAVATMIVDAWQYFCHRAMHMNHWLFTQFHSRHHRLYVPYAYGALYNHPIEGFFMDTLGTGVAYLATAMTVRQSMWFFTLSTIKTVDDHCGYALPFDPMQHISSNNAAYHDIHHQSWGIKTNFSQPFFTFWDRALGTMWTGGDISLKYERTRKAAQVWYEKTHAVGNSFDKSEPELPTDLSYEPDPFQANEIATLPPNATRLITEQPSASQQETEKFPQLETANDTSKTTSDPALRRSTRRKKSYSQGETLKGLKDRVEGSLNIGVPRVDSSG